VARQPGLELLVLGLVDELRQGLVGEFALHIEDVA
jgi:hypothetical protein